VLADLTLYLTMGKVTIRAAAPFFFCRASRRRLAQENGAHITFNAMLSKVYINSILCSVNARRQLAGSWHNEPSQKSTRGRVTLVRAALHPLRPRPLARTLTTCPQNGEVFMLDTVPSPRVMITVDSICDRDADSTVKAAGSDMLDIVTVDFGRATLTMP
jgi:hypothetical protein